MAAGEKQWVYDMVDYIMDSADPETIGIITVLVTLLKNRVKEHKEIEDLKKKLEQFSLPKQMGNSSE